MKNYKRLPCPVFAGLTMAFLPFLFPLAAERPSDVPMLRLQHEVLTVEDLVPSWCYFGRFYKRWGVGSSWRNVKSLNSLEQFLVLGTCVK